VGPLPVTGPIAFVGLLGAIHPILSALAIACGTAAALGILYTLAAVPFTGRFFAPPG